MGDLAYLNIKPERESTGTRPFHGFEIPDWMFDERPHIVSRDDPKSLAYVCQECGLIEAKHVRNGYMRRRCACEMEMYYEEGQVEAKAEMKAVADVQKTGRTYTWLGDAEDDLDGKSLDNFTRDYQKKAYDECESWVKRFTQARQYNDTFSLNMLLMGSYGTGKTHLAAAICNALREQCIPCLFCTAQGFFNVLYGKSFEDKLSLIEQASMTPLLVIDELDKLYVKQASDPDQSGRYQKSTLAEVLDKRYKRKLPTIITTNEQEDLGQWLNGATISRLYERISLLPMNGVDYRSKRG
jgi:DNA replication protein DnaC